MWWSLEKNGKYIILQQSLNKTDVVDTTFDVNQEKMNQRLLPVKELISAKGNGDLESVLESLLVSNQLGLLYHLWSANCQRFASYVFRKCNGEGKTWKTLASGSEANEKESLFGVGVDTIRYNSIDRQTKRSPFYQALIENGEMAELEAILDNDTSEFINQIDCHGYTFLEWADAFSREDVKKYLIEKGAVQSELFRRNVFFIALQYVDSKDELNYPKLSLKEIDITGVNRDKMDNTALHFALYGGKWQVANKILKKMKKLSIPVDAVNEMGETSLHVIAKLTCPIKTFEKILKRIPQDKIDMIDQQGLAPLHWATIIGSLQKIKLLLKKGANINAQTKDGHTALHLALRDELNTDDNEKIVKLLLNNDEAENNNDEIDITTLHHAVLSDTLLHKQFQFILKRFPDYVNAQDDEGDTPLMVAVFNQSTAKVKELLPCSDVKVKNKVGYIALHYAAMWKNIPVDLFNEIIDKSADINAQDNRGHTPLNWALLSKSVTAARQLLIKGANVNLKNKDNEMAIHFAVSWTTIPHDIIQKIVAKTEGNIDSALCLARRHKLTAVIKLLEEKDVTVSPPGNEQN
jgi:ankyrin repeat protein